MSACPLCGDRDERDKAHCSLCRGTGCIGEREEWSDAEKLALAMQRNEQLQTEKGDIATELENVRQALLGLCRESGYNVDEECRPLDCAEWLVDRIKSERMAHTDSMKMMPE